MQRKRILVGWRFMARVISGLFDPVIILPLIIFLLVWRAIVIHQPVLAVMLVVTDLMMPGIAFLYFMREHHFRDWDIHRRRQRFPLLLINTLCQGVGVLCALILGIHVLVPVLLGMWLVTLTFLMVSLIWKISFHTGMNTLLALMMIKEFGWRASWLMMVVTVIAWARVTDRDHTPAQVAAGAIVPLVVMSCFYAWYI